MAFCSFSEGAAIFDSTPIENMFLLDFMPVAPEGFLKVYLYVRMLAAHPELAGDLKAVAEALRMDEDAVYSALAYWEQQGLVRRLSDNPVACELIPMWSQANAARTEDDYYRYRDFNNRLQALFDKNIIHAKELETVNDWISVLGFEQEAALRLAAWGVETSQAKSPKPDVTIKRMDKIAVAWAGRGIRTLAEVERAIAHEDGPNKAARAVLKRFSLRRQPTEDELACARRWMEEWHFTQEDILAACEETTKSSNPSFAYLDAILRSRRDGDETHREALKAVLRELNPMMQPTADDLSGYAELMRMGFEPGTVRLAAVQCHRNRRNPKFETVKAMLAKWREMGLLTQEAAQRYVAVMEEKKARMGALLERCGASRDPKQSDLDRLDVWSEWHAPEVVDFAADCARNSREPVSYMDALLKAWHEAGVTDVEGARAARAAKQAEAAPVGQSANPALNYAQREYRDEDFGEGFFINLTEDRGNGGEQA